MAFHSHDESWGPCEKMVFRAVAFACKVRLVFGSDIALVVVEVDVLHWLGQHFGRGHARGRRALQQAEGRTHGNGCVSCVVPPVPLAVI